jgi:putative transposase
MDTLPPQELRTFFITSICAGHRFLLQSDRMKLLLLEHMNEQRNKRRLQLYEYVYMPDHVHFLLTPGEDVSLEKCLQFVKGGFSFKVKKILKLNTEVWQNGFTEHRIKDYADFVFHVRYIHENPVKKKLVSMAQEYVYSSASDRKNVDPVPEQYRG